MTIKLSTHVEQVADVLSGRVEEPSYRHRLFLNLIVDDQYGDSLDNLYSSFVYDVSINVLKSKEGIFNSVNQAADGLEGMIKKEVEDNIPEWIREKRQDVYDLADTLFVELEKDKVNTSYFIESLRGKAVEVIKAVHQLGRRYKNLSQIRKDLGIDITGRVFINYTDTVMHRLRKIYERIQS